MMKNTVNKAENERSAQLDYNLLLMRMENKTKSIADQVKADINTSHAMRITNEVYSIY